MLCVVIGLSSVFLEASPLPSGPTYVVRTHSAQSLGVSTSRIKAWPNAQNYNNFNPQLPESYYWFEVMNSGVGSRDSGNDNDVLCVGLYDLVSQAIVVGQSECLTAIKTHDDRD